MGIACSSNDHDNVNTGQDLIEITNNGPAAGNQDGDSAIPTEAGLEDVSEADQIIGDETPESCTAQAFIDAVPKEEKLFLIVDRNQLQ